MGRSSLARRWRSLRPLAQAAQRSAKRSGLSAHGFFSTTPARQRAGVLFFGIHPHHRASRCETDLGRLPFLREASFVNVQGIVSIPTNRLERKLGRMPDELLEKIKEALRYALDL
jgi:mRNA interferase MazF